MLCGKAVWGGGGGGGGGGSEAAVLIISRLCLELVLAYSGVGIPARHCGIYMCVCVYCVCVTSNDRVMLNAREGVCPLSCDEAEHAV